MSRFTFRNRHLMRTASRQTGARPALEHARSARPRRARLAPNPPTAAPSATTKPLPPAARAIAFCRCRSTRPATPICTSPLSLLTGRALPSHRPTPPTRRSTLSSPPSSPRACRRGLPSAEASSTRSTLTIRRGTRYGEFLSLLICLSRDCTKQGCLMSDSDYPLFF